MKFVKCILAAFFLVSNTLFTGFVAQTLVKTPNGFAKIEDLEVGDLVECFNDQEISTQKVTKKLSKLENHCVKIVLENGQETIIASEGQQFYLPVEAMWVKAENLKVQDILLNKDKKYIEIQDMYELEEPIEVFDISVQECHTFFVSQHSILVHNFVPLAIGASILFGGGIEFGGVTIGVAAFGVWIINTIKKWKEGCNIQFDFNNATFKANEEAQAPGKPTESDGYKPPKRWDGKKRKSKKGYGWPAEDGKIWVPTGPRGHGGPHWDVQDKNGKTYDNVYPGGILIRPGKK